MSILATSQLTHRYPGGVTALEELTLELDPGVIGLVGANGAGKSTLIKIILGLLQPTAGEMQVLGTDFRTGGAALRRQLGYLPEHDCLPPDVSATDFVTHMARLAGLPSAAARERTADMLRHVGLYEERYRRMEGYSTGMKQRVKLAQALVHDPRLLLLDEPTNGLDPSGRNEMLELVERTGREFDISILLASHLLGEVERVCDFLVLIDAGRLRTAAPVRRLTGRNGALVVEVDRDEEALASRLQAMGLAAERRGPELVVDAPDGAGPDAVRDAAAELDLALLRMERERHGLGQLFRSGAEADASKDQEPADALEGSNGG